MEHDEHLHDPPPHADGAPSADGGGARDRYRELFEEAPEPYLLTDDAGSVLLANSRARELFGAGALTGRDIAELLHPDDRDGLDQQLARAARGEGIHSWEVRLCEGATEPRVLVSVEPTDRDGTAELRWVLWDAMPLDLVRDRLSRLLEDSQGDAAALRALAEWQATLLGSAAQDMRAPLQVIASTIDSLLDDPDSLSTPVAHTMLERASQQVLRLRRLLPTLLQLGRLQLEGPGANRDHVDLHDLVQQTLHDLAPLPAAVDLDLHVRRVHADRTQLARVLVELVTHALEYGPQAASLTLGSAARGVDVELHLDVTEYELREQVRQVMFSPFLGTGRGGEEANGDDLGLSLVAVFARMHGGRAWVEDLPDGGTSFRVLLSNALPDSHTETDPTT